jgi:hypothetical protein
LPRLGLCRCVAMKVTDPSPVGGIDATPSATSAMSCRDA